jgi:WD40 repeat protein
MLWDVSNGESVASHMTSSPMSDLAVAPEKDVIITGHMDGTVRAFSIPRLLPQAEYHMGATVMSVDCDEKTGTVAAVAEGGRLSLLSKDMTWMRDLDVSPRDVFDLRFSPDGRQLAGGAWFAWLFWDIRQGTVRIKRSPHFGKAIAIDYSPDGKWLVSLGRITDGNIYLLNLQTGFVERRLEAHVSCGGAVRFGPKGHFIASGGDDESVRIYDFRRDAHKQINN